MESRFEVKGLKETLEAFTQLQNEIGDKDAKSKVLIPAARDAMKPVLAMAKAMVPKDTGLLERSLYVTARRPTKKDMKSRYVSPKDSVISIVSTRPIPKKLKKEFYSQSHIGNYLNELGKYKKNSSERNAIYKKIKKEKKNFYESKNAFYDARGIANEFGTANMSANPFMRSSLESQAQSVSTLLGQILKLRIESYKPKQKI